MIDSNRTRRSVIKKLKELGLIFKAPTRKSLAAQVNKNHWNREQDEQLRNMWDENRMSENVLEILMEVFSQQDRSQNNLINRMMQIGLIANRSEILPDKPKKSRAPKSSGQGGKKVPKKAKTTNKKLNVKKIKELLTEIEENLKNGLEWLIESFNDAAVDFEEVSEDPEDCIPLVPISAPQHDAIDNPQFQSLLQEIGVQESDSYWRIPGILNADELKLRADILSGAEIEDDPLEADESDDDIQSNSVVSCDSNSEDEVDDNQFAAWRQKITNNLIYNKSDDEERVERIAHKPVKKATKKSKDTFDKLKNKSNENVDDLCEGNSQSLRSRLAELTNSSDTSDEDDAENIDKSRKKNNANSKVGVERKRMKRIMIDSSDSEIDDGNKSAAVIATDSGDEDRVRSKEISRNSNNDAREENSNQSSNSNGEIDTNPINKSTSSSSIVVDRTAVATEEAAAAEMETNENSGGDDKGVDGSSETSAEKMVIAGDKKKRDRSYLSDSSDDSSSIQNKKHKNHSRRLVLSDDDE